MSIIITLLEWFFIGKIFGGISKWFDKIFDKIFYPKELVKRMKTLSNKINKQEKKNIPIIPEPNMIDMMVYDESYTYINNDNMTTTTYTNTNTNINNGVMDLGYRPRHNGQDDPMMNSLLYRRDITPVAYQSMKNALKERVLSKLNLQFYKK